MKPANAAFLEANMHHWVTLRDAFYLRSLDGNTRSEMQRILSEEFAPGYSTDLWCSTCVVDMIKLLYQNYDKYKASQIMEIIPDTTGEPITVKASFPKQERDKGGKFTKKLEL